MHQTRQARFVHVHGLVQGVGFRPFDYRIAMEAGLDGWTRNTGDGVHIRVEGPESALKRFIRNLKVMAPPASDIYSVDEQTVAPEFINGFYIRDSESLSDHITQVSPDIAVCGECLTDLAVQTRRADYPFINCTHCGPRFTIIRELPYDRPNTTMAPFEMCPECQREYDDPADRRFHAQPAACHYCGPEYTLISGQSSEDRTHITGIKNILEECTTRLKEGKIIAVKGVGGFFLICDALNRRAVARLREEKRRNAKPFAVMVRNLETASFHAFVSSVEAELLASWRRPIVLLKQRNTSPLVSEINEGCSTIGLMLPYMPFHYQLFDRLSDGGGPDAIVMTSGNLSDEPIIIENKKALEQFGNIADAVLLYNRDIHNRADDSVLFVVDDAPRLIRRSRGFVPEPVRLPYSVEGLLAAGAELSHCFAVGKGNMALLSQHIGDLKDPETYAFFDTTVTRFCDLFRVQPEMVVCDKHPDYLSSSYARETGLPVMEVMHHHAHMAACMAEYGLDEPVMGVCWDGTGLGSDGHIWGGEFLIGDLSTVNRFARFSYIPLPGGDKAALEPWRTGISLLYQTFGKDMITYDLPFLNKMRKKPEWNLVLQAMERNINCPLSSAAGRLFDGIAAITEVCQLNTYHAEAPMKLEALVDESMHEAYPFYYHRHPEEVGRIDFTSLIRSVVMDLKRGLSLTVISTKFHNALVNVITEVVGDMKARFHTDKVILTGGVFQNRYLLEKAEAQLKKHFKVYSPERIPANDAGIALGQIIIAAKKRNTENYS